MTQLGQVLDAVAAGRAGDRHELTRLARELRARLPRQQVTVSRRGLPLVHSRVVALRVLVGDRVFRVDTTIGRAVCQVGHAVNGVVSAHTEVPAQQWAAGLRAALEGSASTGLGGQLGPVQ